MEQLRGSVLIAEPDRAERMRLARVLGPEGYLPFETASCRGALTLAREMAFDLVLLDAWLPDGEGLEACERLLALVRGIRVILITDDPSREFRRDALSVGAYSVVPKPVAPRLVLATMAAALGGPRVWSS